MPRKARATPKLPGTNAGCSRTVARNPIVRPSAHFELRTPHSSGFQFSIRIPFGLQLSDFFPSILHRFSDGARTFGRGGFVHSFRARRNTIKPAIHPNVQRIPS